MEEFKRIIKQYLDKFAKKDAVFASKYDGEAKSIDSCCEYIISEAKKGAGKNNAVGVPDKIVFGWAVHFFDEKPVVEGRIVAKVSVSKEQQKEDFERRQLSLFPDML